MPEATIQPDASQPAGWSDPELVNPHANTEKADKVRGMFAAIAKSYDLNNRLHSMWRDQAWRRFAVKQAMVKPGEHVLDVACGTGDLTQAFAERTPASRVVGADFTEAMIRIAGSKLARMKSEPAAKISYTLADAMELPFENASFDVVSIAFGIRNVSDPARALREFRRVLRAGGRLLILEFDRPRNPIVGMMNDWYCGWLMPRTATLVSGDKSGAYKYLPRSVGTFMSREELMGLMATVGCTGVTSTPLSLGICVCYRGFVA